ncbi:sister chromatid cohesion 1 protein 3-like isoform X2 [Iris pallida]|uniref:Sister chromatid cohesion 1 protein 3-like isoform X2 n=1 Tax=Iris pallida TaxID=29817 RepID=A0AAX6HLI0_IRIPA|nr:sister chromatid cohesion 1 protein 3-like isoform X2 [Iris pallida]
MNNRDINEYFNSSSLAEGVEVRKAQEDSQQRDELESRGNLGVSISEGPRSLEEQSEHQVKFQETKPSNMAREVQIDEAKIQTESTNLNITKPLGIKESHEKSNLTDDAGLPSPKFAVATPAKRETSRMLRKRKKNMYDENIVLPNEILRMWIHDASNLVCKRRKAPHTTLDAWKVNRMINLQEYFMEPLVPCNSLERIATPQKKSCDHSPLKKSQSLTDPAPMMKDIPNNFSDPGINKELQSLKVSKADTSYEGIIKESNTLEISSSGLDIVDQEIGSAEKDNGIEADGWSTRTRVVAQYLCRSLLDLNGQKQKKIQGLAQILEGQTRAKCARFFCETLTLKSHDYIDVKQDHPYSDIIISATPRLEAFFKNQ